MSFRQTLFAVFTTLAAAACGGSGDSSGGTGPGTTPTGSFAVNSASAVSVSQSASATVTITVSRSGGFSAPVILSAAGLPAGVTAAFNPATVVVGNTTSTLTLTPSGATPLGTTIVTISGAASGASNQTASFSLTITAGAVAGPFTMALSVTSYLALPATVVPAGPTLTVTRNAGFTGAVALSTMGLPATLGVFYSPASLTGTTATLTILDVGATPAGTYTATVRGVAAGGLGERSLTFQIVVAPPTTGSIHWKFCSGSLPQYFFAVRDGTGPWTRVVPGLDSVYSFTVGAGVGSVAMVTNDSGGYRTTVYQYTAAELAARGPSQCALVQNVTTRTVNGTVAGVSGFRTSQIGMGWWSGSTNGNGSFSLLNLPSGALDVIAMRNADVAIDLDIPTDRVIIRRGVNPASGSTLPVLDFGAAESFAPTTSTWTFNNVNAGEKIGISQAFISAAGSTGPFALYPGVDRDGASRSIYGVPLAQTIAGDLHQVVATINSVGTPAAAPNRASRQIIAYARTLADRAIAFGPAMPTPSVTAVPGAPAGRLRATGTLPTEYSAGVSFDVTQTATARFATVHTTRDFLNTAGIYDVQIPDLTAAIGWDTQFAIRAGVPTNWWVSGGGPVLDFYDGRYIFNSTHSRWTGAQTGIVAPADGATYLMGRVIGTATP